MKAPRLQIWAKVAILAPIALVTLPIVLIFCLFRFRRAEKIGRKSRQHSNLWRN